MQDSVIFHRICGRQGYHNLFLCQCVTCTRCIKQLKEASETQESQRSWIPGVTERGIHLTRLYRPDIYSRALWCVFFYGKWDEHSSEGVSFFLLTVKKT